MSQNQRKNVECPPTAVCYLDSKFEANFVKMMLSGDITIV